MVTPARGLAIVEAEVGVLTMAMKRGQLWSRSSESLLHPALLAPFLALKKGLASAKDLDSLEPSVFLAPFLDVIRSETVTGPVTGLALAAVHKFLAYGLLHGGQPNVANAVESLADAVTHARFVGVDPSSDEIVLMKIMEVLRTLMLSPVGLLLTNESICEIMQSTFRICFENRLSELLRKTAEHALNDMIQLLFTRLPYFSEENLPLLKKLKMRNSYHHQGEPGRSRRRHHGAAGGSGGGSKGQRSKAASVAPSTVKQSTPVTAQSVSPTSPSTPLPSASTSTPEARKSPQPSSPSFTSAVGTAATIPSSTPSEQPTSLPPSESVTSLASSAVADNQFSVDHDVLARSPIGSVTDLTAVQSDDGGENESSIAKEEEKEGAAEGGGAKSSESSQDVEITVTSPKGTVRQAENEEREQEQEAVSEKDHVTIEEDEEVPGSPRESSEFVNSQGVTFTPTAETVDDSGSPVPYGLPCVRELLRFLVSLINPHDPHNSDPMVQIALSLLATAMETGADALDRFESLLALVKDDLARNLVALLSAERVSTFSSALWLSYLLISNQRGHLKYQLEIFLCKLNDVICSESQKVTYEHKELGLDLIVRLYRLPGFLTQLYLNFDCDMYTSNVFEDLTKMLSKNAFPVTGLYSTHFLSLDALLTVVEVIETQCQKRILTSSDKAYPAITSTVRSTPAPAISTNKELSSPSSPLPAAIQMGSCSGHQFALLSWKGSEEFCRPKEEERQPDIKVPTHEEVMALKHKKKLIATATEQFNTKPTKGVSYMQECGLLKTPPEPPEIARFMRQNPHLDKKQMGEYISNRKNLVILEAFCNSFDFRGVRIDEALRQFLETFRLPGEAPLITLVLEHFADHWFQSNVGSTTVVSPDSAFTLSYAVIMLNVDQHNKNHTKTNDPMTEEQFKRNLRGTNDQVSKGDHDQELLKEIFHAIKNEEIVMPAEQTGLVRENYLWKCVLKRGQEDGDFLMAGDGQFDHDIFSIIWGPTVAALSYVFDRSTDQDAVSRALDGFQRCATIAAHYRMSDVFDNLVISLCKFTTLLTASEELPHLFLPAFGANEKAMAATRTVFALVQRNGDILREGWKNVAECLLQLFKCRLLPKTMMVAEDFLESSGQIELYREEKRTAKVEPGLLNSFVSFISMSTAAEAQQRARTPEEEEAAEAAARCVRGCALESLVTESKFLLAESLQELVRFLVSGSQLDVGPGRGDSQGGLADGAGETVGGDDEHATLFFLELLVRVTVQNRDRVGIVWRQVSDHLARLIVSSSSGPEKSFLLERSVTALLRLAVRLSRKEDLASTVVQSLRILLALKVNVTFAVCRHVAFGLHELLRNNAANVHESEDWAIVFSLVEVVGAGANPNATVSGGRPGAAAGGVKRGPRRREAGDRAARRGNEDSGHGASSESETANSRSASPARRERSESISSGGWIVLGNSPTKQQQHQQQDEAEAKGASATSEGLVDFDRNAIVHVRPLVMHDSLSFLKCCESLAFLVRDVAHITPHNFGHCVAAIRTFVEASFQSRSGAGSSEEAANKKAGGGGVGGHASRSHAKKTPMGRAPPMRRVQSAPNNMDYDADESDGEDYSSEYLHVAMQLLDLMHTLHTRAGQIHRSWAEEEEGEETSAQTATTTNLWETAWCPLLQGIARFCCDKRSHIRTSALTTLQRALLFQDLQQALSPTEWEGAFTQVLFPMLSHLLVKSSPGEKTAMEETRTRAATLLGKVFLQHLAPLSTLPSFTALWLTVLDFMRRFIGAAASDLLADAVPESLKNMLLVMDTAGLFFSAEEDGSYPTPIWSLTAQKLDMFLPKLMEELFGKRQQVQQLRAGDAEPQVEREQDSDECQAEKPLLPPPSAPTAREEEVPPPSPLDPPVLSSKAFEGQSSQPRKASKEEEETKVDPKQAQPQASAAVLHQQISFNMGPPTLLPSSAMRASTAVGPPKAGTAATTSCPPPPAVIDATGPISIPSLPQIAPLPPPPISLPQPVRPESGEAAAAPLPSGNFQPIHVPPRGPPSTGAGVTALASPKPIPPVPGLNLTSYFGMQQVQQGPSFGGESGGAVGAGGAGGTQPSPVQPVGAPPQNLASNILTAAFSPTIANPATTIFLSSPTAAPAEERSRLAGSEEEK